MSASSTIHSPHRSPSPTSAHSSSTGRSVSARSGDLEIGHGSILGATTGLHWRRCRGTLMSNSQLHIWCTSKEDASAGPDRDRVDQPWGAGLRHLLPAARQPHRLPRHGDRRHRRQPRRRPAAAPRVGVDEQGHLAVHQLARRRHDRAVRHPRHHALRRARTWPRSASGRRRRRRPCCSPPARPASATRCPTRACSSTSPTVAPRASRRTSSCRSPRSSRCAGGWSTSSWRPRASPSSGSPPTSTATTSCAAQAAVAYGLVDHVIDRRELAAPDAAIAA